MALFFKDLFPENKRFFAFDVLFGESHIVINSKKYKYNEILTAFLNYDVEEYISAMAQNHSTEKLNNIILQLPLFRDFNPFGLIEKIREEEYTALLEDLEHLDRYRQFLKDVGYKKDKSFIQQIVKNGMTAFVADKTMGASVERETTVSKIQYLILEDRDGDANLFERIGFSRLIDFIYTDFFKGIMKESVPKQCKLCGTYFLLEKGFHYEYCNTIFEAGQTCREVGATKSFKAKTDNNDVWKLHQRAYKKYYARVLKKKMSKGDFNTWATAAEKLRDEYLPRYSEALAEGKTLDLTEYTKLLNSI